MESVGESVSTNKRKGDGQRELQEEAGKSKKTKQVQLQARPGATGGIPGPCPPN